MREQKMTALSERDRSSIIEFLDSASNSISVLSVEAERGATDIDDLMLKVESLLQDVTLLLDLFPPEDGDKLLLGIADVYNWLESKKVISLRNRGRPVIHIPEDQLLSFSFSPKAIASMLHVSEKTVRRRIQEFGLEDMRIYSTISDAELDAITIEFVASSPSSGQVTYDGFLRGRGLDKPFSPSSFVSLSELLSCLHCCMVQNCVSAH